LAISTGRLSGERDENNKDKERKEREDRTIEFLFRKKRSEDQEKQNWF